jgi:ferredoxin
MADDKATHKIEYDRDGCIGAGACVAMDPDNWFMDDDGKATVRKTDLTDEQVQANANAAKACPVAVIRVKKLSTGEQVAP